MKDTQYGTDMSPSELRASLARFPFLRVRTRTARTTGGMRKVSTIKATVTEIPEEDYYDATDAMIDLGAYRVIDRNTPRVSVPKGPGITHMEPMTWWVVHLDPGLVEFTYDTFHMPTVGRRLDEASLSRVWRQWNDTGFAIVSSERHERTPQGNRAAFQDLKRKVREAGYGFVPLIGVWAEEGQPPAEEPALFIPAVRPKVRHGDAPRLRELAVEWCGDFNQEAVIFSWPGGPVELVDAHGNIQMKFTEFHPNKVGIAYSRFRGAPGTFMFEGWRWSAPPKSWMEAVRRQGEGELRFIALEG
jgi:hypothetical protein